MLWNPVTKPSKRNKTTLGMLWNPVGWMKSMEFKGWKKRRKKEAIIETPLREKIGVDSTFYRTMDKKVSLVGWHSGKKCCDLWYLVKWWFPSLICVFVVVLSIFAMSSSLLAGDVRTSATQSIQISINLYLFLIISLWLCD